MEQVLQQVNLPVNNFQRLTNVKVKYPTVKTCDWTKMLNGKTFTLRINTCTCTDESLTHPYHFAVNTSYNTVYSLEKGLPLIFIGILMVVHIFMTQDFMHCLIDQCGSDKTILL